VGQFPERGRVCRVWRRDTKGAHTRRGLWKVNPRVSVAARQTFVCVDNAASGFLLFSRLSPVLEVFLAGKGQVTTNRGVCG
jgi:hypothetical protein